MNGETTRLASVSEVLAAVAREHPAREAILSARGVVLSYAELWDEVCGRGRALDDRLGEGTYVEVVGGHGLETALSCVAAVVSGRAYAVIDASWPDAYRRRLTALLGARGRLETADDSTTLRRLPGPVATAARHAPGAQAPMCVFTTSGTTGTPKGVVVPHRAILRTCVRPDFLRTSGSLRMPQLAPLTWDAGALELWAPLLSGGTCVIPDFDADLSDRLRWSVAERSVNAVWLTSSLFNLVADHDPMVLDGVEIALTGGERLSPTHVRRMMTALPRLRVVNGYGPVETTVFATTHEVRLADLDAPHGIPLGRPIRATQVRVVGPGGEEVGTGAAGEIVVGGRGVALGYLDDDLVGRGGFVDGPTPESRAYRTGDLGMINEEGVLVHLGRVDSQLKVAGVRVDAVGLESLAERVAGVRSCIVCRRPDALGNTVGLTLAYTADGNTGTHELEPAIRQAFADLPRSARPDRFVRLTSLPVTANGKVDRLAAERLCGPPSGGLVDTGGSSTAQDAKAASIPRVVADILGVGELDDRCSVVALGASSLQVMQLAARLTAATGRQLTAADVYSAPSVRALGDGVERLPARGATLKTANLVAETARRYWTSERLAPGSQAHLAACVFRCQRGHEQATVVDAVRRAARTYFTGFRSLQVRGRHGLVRGPVLRADPPISVRARPWEGPAQVRAAVGELGRGVHDLVAGPWAAFDVVVATGTTSVLGVFHHVAVDTDGLRSFAALLDAELAGPGPGPAPRRIGSALYEPVRWTAQDAAYWSQALSGLPPAPWGASPLRGFADLWSSPPVTVLAEIDPDAVEAPDVRAARLGVPEIAVHLTDVAHCARSALDVEDLCVGVMLGRAPSASLGRGCLARPVPVRLRPGVREVPDVAAAVLDALAHAAVPYDEVLRLAPRQAGPLGPYPVMLNLLDERRPQGAVSVESLPPTAPVAQLYIEVVRRPGGRLLLRGVAPDRGPYPHHLEQIVQALQGRVRAGARV